MFDSTKYIPVLEKIIRDAKIKERIENAVELTYCITNELDANKINKAIGLANDLLYGAKASRETLKNLIDDLQTLAEKYEQPALELATGGVIKDKVCEHYAHIILPREIKKIEQQISGPADNIIKKMRFESYSDGSGTITPSEPTPAGISGTGGGTVPNNAGYAHTIVKPIPPDPKPAVVSGDNITKKKPPSCDISACTRQVDTCCYYCGWHDRCDEHCMMGSIGCEHKKISHTEEEPKPAGVSGDNQHKILNTFMQAVSGPDNSIKRMMEAANRADGTEEQLEKIENGPGINTFIPTISMIAAHDINKDLQEQPNESKYEFEILNMVNKALNTVKELSMSRNALNTSILQDVEKVRDMFLSKNNRYGQDKDGLFNFTQGAKLLYGDASPDNTFRTLMGYVSKHIVTLSQPDALTNDNEFEDRCLDVAVYMMIARAMKKATREGANKNDELNHTRD